MGICRMPALPIVCSWQLSSWSCLVDFVSYTRLDFKQTEWSMDTHMRQHLHARPELLLPNHTHPS